MIDTKNRSPHLITPEKRAPDVSDNLKYFWVIAYSLLLITFGLLIETPQGIVSGLWAIMTSPGNLLTDYMAISNVGSAFVNSGLLTLIHTLLAKKMKVKMNGPLTAAIYTMCGFSFFGKNLFNSIPIILGIYLFSKWEKKPFSNYILINLFGTALAPAVSHATFGIGLPLPLGLLLGTSIGVIIGLLLPPLSVHFLSFHQGFNLYNIGFTAGIIGMVITSVLRMYGYEVQYVSHISEGNNGLLASFLYFSFTILFLIGFISNNRSFHGLKNLLRSSGKLISDFIILDGYGITLINMSLLGFLATTYVLIVGGQLNGPIVGGILTIVGFGAYGKHLRNVPPIVAGVFLASILTDIAPSSTSSLLAALFGTTLAPISGFYGMGFGVLAGFLHMALVTNVGFLHGGLNLYNNGFSGGFIAAFMVPLLDNLLNNRKERTNARRASKSRTDLS